MQLDFWNYRLLYCQGPKPEWSDDPSVEQWYVSARTLCLVRPGKDAIVLPSGRLGMQEFADFCRGILGLSQDQILWTSGQDYLLDEGIYKEQMPAIRKLISTGCWMLAPYCCTESFIRWASELKVPVLGDSLAWAKKYADKAILHPHVHSHKRPKELPILHGINVPQGWICDDRRDLEAAFCTMFTDGVGRFILKPRFSSAGEGIIRDITSWTQLEDYNFDQFGEVVLEEMLPYDGISSIQFYGQQLLAYPTDQLLSRIHPSKYAGNIVPSRKSAKFQRDLIEDAQCIIDQIKPQGLGALDFLSVDDEPRFIDPNLGRWTGGWIGRAFHMLVAPRKNCYKKWDMGPEQLGIPSVRKFWEKLESKGIAFKPASAGKSGVFPMCWLPNMWVTLIALGDTHEEVEILEAQMIECLAS